MQLRKKQKMYQRFKIHYPTISWNKDCVLPCSSYHVSMRLLDLHTRVNTRRTQPITPIHIHTCWWSTLGKDTCWCALFVTASQDWKAVYFHECNFMSLLSLGCSIRTVCSFSSLGVDMLGPWNGLSIGLLVPKLPPIVPSVIDIESDTFCILYC
jgi:hypothetical protein